MIAYLPEWVEQFELERARASHLASRRAATSPPTSRTARAEHRRAEKELDKAGVK